VISLEHLVEHFISLLVPHDFLVPKTLISDRIFLTNQVICLKVNRKETHWLDATFDCYSVDLTTDGLHFVGHYVVEVT
jgi:hypothetical protein